MRAAIPTELLLRLMNATPEQYAAVERILGCRAENGKQKAESEDVEFSTPHPALSPIEAERVRAARAITPLSEDVARSAFALLQKLEMDAPLKAPSVLTVFRL